MNTSFFQVRFFLLLLFFIVLNHSCSFNSKEIFLSNFTQFVSDVEQNYSSYSEIDWKSSDSSFKQFIETDFETFQDNLTAEDKETIGKLVGRYSVVRVNGYGKQLNEEIDNAKDSLKGFLNELSEETNKNNN